MPTDLPPDYKPRPVDDPANPADPAVPGAVPAIPEPGGADAVDPGTGAPRPGNDVSDPPGWAVPPVVPGGDKADVPLPAGMPTF